MQEIIKFFFELGQRFFSKNPKFFKKLMWFLGGCSSVILGLLVLNRNFGWGWGIILIAKIPLTYILFNISTLFAGMAIMARLPQEDK